MTSIPNAPKKMNPKWQSLIRRHAQRGYGLMEAVGAIAVFGAISYGYSQVAISRSEIEIDGAVAQHAVEIQSGVNKYINDNRLALIGTPTPTIAGITNSLAPSIADLSSAGGGTLYLPPNFNVANVVGMNYTIAITRLPAACAPGVSCSDVAAVIQSTAPLLDSSTGQAAATRLGRIANNIGIDAAFSKEGSGTTLIGTNGPWTQTNPAGNTPGMLVMKAGFGSMGYGNLDHLLPRDGSRPMVGALNANGNNINGVATLSGTNAVLTGNVSAANANLSGSVSASGNVSASGETYTGGWFRSTGASTGWYHQAYNGGLYMADSSWVRSYADKGVYTGGQVQAGSLQSNSTISAAGTINAGENVIVRGAVIAGAYNYSYGPSYSLSDSFPMQAYGAGGNPTAAPQNSAGSAYVNDIYLRSVNRWASQIATSDVPSGSLCGQGSAYYQRHYSGYEYFAGYTLTTSCMGNNPASSCPSGYAQVEFGRKYDSSCDGGSATEGNVCRVTEVIFQCVKT
jgi:hypothetical protein